MMRHVCLGLLVLAWGLAQAGTQQIVLSERLNARWVHEPVTYPVTFAAGACVAESVRLTGPDGPLPAQLSQVELWPETRFVKSATLAFVVDELTPLATQTYEVTFGPAPATGNTPAPDLRVTVTDTRVEATTSRFGARLLLGAQTYDPPAAAKDVPAPVQGLCRANGAWFGGSRLYGETAISSYTATLTDRGPAFVQVAYRYTYQDGNTLDLTVRLDAQGDRAYFVTAVKDNKQKDGWDLLLTPGLPALQFQFMPEVQRLQQGAHEIKGGWKEKNLADAAAGDITYLAPWGDWWNEFTQTKFYLKYADSDAELVITRQDAGDWVTPGGERNKLVPLQKGADSLWLRVNNASGARKWSIGENPNWETKLPRRLNPQNTFQDDLHPLNVVKDMVLDWPASAEPHPRLLLTAAEVAKAGVDNPAALKEFQNSTRAKSMLGAYGYYDTMRNAGHVIALYDGSVDAPATTPEERKLLRAQMAYLAYRLASSANWDAERGFASGNPNMTVSMLINQGLAACALRDHPMAKTWIAKPLAYMEAWMNRLDAAGYWNESGHYGRVSVSKFLIFAIALEKAGFRDYLSDPRLQRMGLLEEQMLTPVDPQHVLSSSPANAPRFGRVSPPIGRGTHASNWGLGGLFAHAFAKSNPALAKTLQWSAQQTWFGTNLGEGLSGLDALYVDRTLPAEAPAWESVLVPSVGPIFRSGIGDPAENYLWLVTKYPTNPDGEFWPSEVGALLTWFAKGKPISRRYPSMPDMNHDHGLLCNRVMLATNWQSGQPAAGGYYAAATPQGLALLPRLNYAGVEFTWKGNWMQVTPPATVPAFPPVAKAGQLPAAGQPPQRWQRQALWINDDTPSGVQYLVLRDTVRGGQPTQWQFWTNSEKIGTPEEAANREAFLADKPGVKNMPARALAGNRFTAVGQLGVDVDYYIAAPTDTPRHTLRYGTPKPGNYGTRPFPFYQDLLHLQLPGDGAYFVALYPHLIDEETPTFTTLGEGTVIKVSGRFGTDYAFLSDQETQATAEDATFAGTVASVQHRPTGIVLALGAAGTVGYGGYGLTAPAPASLRVAEKQLVVRRDAALADATLTLTAPGAWTLDAGSTATLTPAGATLTLTLPAGMTQVTLAEKKTAAKPTSKPKGKR